LKKYLNLLLFIGIIFISPLAQDIQHEVGVINIEVPVRVFKGSQFIDDLTINDFELFENDILQKIETVYLINKKAIKKHEGSEIPAPQVSRHFVLMFELTEYLPRVGDSIEYFLIKSCWPGVPLLLFLLAKIIISNRRPYKNFPAQRSFPS